MFQGAKTSSWWGGGGGTLMEETGMAAGAGSRELISEPQG